MDRRLEPTTRQSLVLRLKNREDQEAWTQFVEIYEPLIYRLATGKGLQDADAQDLCQDVLRAVSSAIERWDPDPAKGSFRGWLFRIARNLLVNFLAGQARQARGSGRTSIHELLQERPAADPRAEAEYADEFRRRAFQWAAERVKNEFTNTTWQAFWKTGVENQSIALVATELGLSDGAVYIARSRVLARLRQRVLELSSDIDLFEGGCVDGRPI
jgi:RNA polymerase sigma-70 factor (ECF subfamily)